MKPSVALIGPGKVGCAVCRLLLAAGYPPVAVIGRDLERAWEACRFIGGGEELAGTDLAAVAAADILLLAVPDDQLQPLAQRIQQQCKLTGGQVLVHFSGLHPAECLRHPEGAAQLLSLHPLLPFASRELAVARLPGCPCAIEGDALALPLAQQLVEAIGGRPFRVASEQKALYHASACLASNYLVTLLGTARDLLAACDIPESEALPLLQPLLQATLDNALSLGPEAGLTGPIVRGDAGTVNSHLRALEAASPATRRLYRLLGEQTLVLAKNSGRLSAEAAERLQALLK